jgi:hypothetical protein
MYILKNHQFLLYLHIFISTTTVHIPTTCIPVYYGGGVGSDVGVIFGPALNQLCDGLLAGRGIGGGGRGATTTPTTPTTTSIASIATYSLDMYFDVGFFLFHFCVLCRLDMYFDFGFFPFHFCILRRLGTGVRLW